MEHYAGSQKNNRKSDQHFRFLKSLGQNFLQDEEVIGKILDGSDIGPEDLVIEVGPGSGALTVEAARRAGRLVAVELDSRLIPVLKAALVNADNAIDLAHAERCPLPFQSCMVEDCIGRGKSMQEGGAIYNFTGPQGFGIANMADALYVIKTLVYEQKKYTLCDFADALENNYGKDMDSAMAAKLTQQIAASVAASGRMP